MTVALPPELLVTLLADARQHGRPFDDTWPVAVAAATKGCRERSAWVAALEATRQAWQRAHDRTPATKAEQAAAMLMVDDVDLVGA